MMSLPFFARQVHFCDREVLIAPSELKDVFLYFEFAL